MVKSDNISDLVGFESFKGVREEVKETAPLQGPAHLAVQFSIQIELLGVLFRVPDGPELVHVERSDAELRLQVTVY